MNCQRKVWDDKLASLYNWRGVSGLAAACLSLSITGCRMSAAATSQALLTSNSPAATTTVHLWVAAYYYPNGPGLDEWNRLIEAAKHVPIVAIVNPASGPGDHQDLYFAALLPRARKSGLTLVGYIGTEYARKSIAQAEQEVDTYLKFYPDLQGFHFDEQSSDAANVDYYQTLYKYVRSKNANAVVINNPGTMCSSEYISRPAADVVCLFEGNRGFEAFQPPSWTSQWPSSRFCIVAYQVPDESHMLKYLKEAVQKRIGYIYITDAGGSNPYRRLPSYWGEEVNAIEQLNKAASSDK